MTGTVAPDATLTAWAADCAEHALATFPDFADPAATAAIAAARAWARAHVQHPSSAASPSSGISEPHLAAGSCDADDPASEQCREAAYAAHLSARELAEAGYQAAAAVVRAAGNAAASADDPELALVAADYAVEAVAGNSAPCELPSGTAAERRWQWLQLPPDRRPALFAVEPPEPPAPACVL